MEEKNESNNEDLVVEEVVEGADKGKDSDEEKGLSLRDALNVGVEAFNDKEEQKVSKKEESVEEKESTKVASVAPSTPTYSAPSEWTEEEKQDFYNSSPKQQEASLRLHRSRNSKLEEIKAAAREYDHIRQLNESITPFIKAMGIKERPDVAVQKAVQLWKEFEYTDDPNKAAAEYLRAKGIEPPKELVSIPENNPLEQKINSIQQTQNAILNRIAEEQQRQVGASLLHHWNSFEETKNANGAFKYPDLKTESGPKIAAMVGSLVNRQTDLSKQFIATVEARIPDLSYYALLEEAYKFAGGKVDNSAPRSQPSVNKHINKAKRAAASRPGGSTMVPLDIGSKKLPRREALQYAMREVLEND